MAVPNHNDGSIGSGISTGITSKDHHVGCAANHKGVEYMFTGRSTFECLQALQWVLSACIWTAQTEKCSTAQTFSAAPPQAYIVSLQYCYLLRWNFCICLPKNGSGKFWMSARNSAAQRGANKLVYIEFGTPCSCMQVPARAALRKGNSQAVPRPRGMLRIVVASSQRAGVGNDDSDRGSVVQTDRYSDVRSGLGRIASC